MRKSKFWLMAGMLLGVTAANAQSILINEEWAKVDKESEIFFNEKTKQVAILTPNTGYNRVLYNTSGTWLKPKESTRVAENLIGGLRATGIDGDSLLFRSEDPGNRQQWFAYSLETQMSRVRMKDVPSGMRSVDNFGAVYRADEEVKWH